MLKGINPENFGITPFKSGDPIFETERVANFDYSFLRSGNKDEEMTLSSIFKPDKDEFKGLSKGLEYFKFTEEEVKVLYNLIGGAIKMAASITTVIGIFNTVTELIGLFSSEADESEQRLIEMSKRVQAIHGHLVFNEKKDLYKEARDWESDYYEGQNPLSNVRNSRSEDNLDALTNYGTSLSKALIKMLKVGTAYITFDKSTYGYQSLAGHWIDAIGSPALMLASNSDILSLRHKDSGELADLQKDNAKGSDLENYTTGIWDAGYYIDVLYCMLQELLIVTIALEPLHRSTGQDRERLCTIAAHLEIFIERWRSSLVVANPAAGLSLGRKGLYNPLHYNGITMEGPYNPLHDFILSQKVNGILIGAVDPVTGISSLRSFKDFAIEYQSWHLSEENILYIPYAAEPEKALRAAMREHARLVDQVIQTCGISSLIDLHREYLNVSRSSRSNLVKLPNANFRSVSSVPGSNDEGTPETVDLGGIKIFTDPKKTYEATRFHRVFEKTFRFKMARRTEISEIQLGYRLRIADKDIVLCKFSSAPAGGIEFVHFPKEPIEVEHSFDTEVYDCYQVRHFSAGDEDKFESEGEDSERVFLNKREGRSRIGISIHFEPLAEGKDDAHAGEAVITIRNLEPEVFPDAFILNVSVFETIRGFRAKEQTTEEEMTEEEMTEEEMTEEEKKKKKRLKKACKAVEETTEEWLADSMTLHMSPSYLIVGQDFMDDYRETLARMTKVITSINEKYSIKKAPIPQRPVPDPSWAVRHRALEIENGLSFIKAALLEQPVPITEEIERFRPPSIL